MRAASGPRRRHHIVAEKSRGPTARATSAERPGEHRKVYSIVRPLHECMKTVTLDEEAYEILAALKVDARDSFSKVVKRHFRKSGRIRSSAGTSADATDDGVAALRQGSPRELESDRRQ